MNSYKSVSPRTQLAAYTPNMEVNFDLIHPDEAYEPDTCFLTGLLSTSQTTADGSQNNFIDQHAGVAACFENVIVRCDLFQEIITNYGRHVKQNNALQYSSDSLCAGLKQSGELLAPHINLYKSILTTYDGAAQDPIPFCHKWMNCLNNMDGNLAYEKSGRIQLSFKLPSVQKVVFGADAALLTNYSLSNLELHYRTSPMPSPTVSVVTVEDTQKLIQTSDTTVQNTFINPVSSVLVSFAQTSVETDVTQNNLVCQRPPISRMSWVYNDQSNRLVAYDIETLEEQVLSGLSVLNTVGAGIDIRDMMTMATLAVAAPTAYINDNKFLVGLNFGQDTKGNQMLMDFSKSGLGLNVRLSDITTQYYAYFYGYGKRQIV